ncbi:YdeI/OmpD-associated family protein [Cognatilysobacter lacus]|uniref:YdhG-like domain-containing protein n=1 Tax=Cognatilysobacter lacus TaxID=1643323 RepID=A0A5D8YLI9_9GAMM|nr:YdeI/OmpD-associated family protein [Lysobacter lacus]TZF83421.1 hypothetical protein FW784_13035 [Lysobacter lacus]
MTAHDERVDAYIERAAPFARPLLRQLRRDLHAASPALDESIRWGMPAFLHDGRIVAMLAAFKQHASLTLWRAGDNAARREGEGMGQFGRLTTLAELPNAATIAARVREAIARIAGGVPTPPRNREIRPEAVVPDELRAALDAHPAAAATFASFPPGQRREYVDWITEAKRDDTRARRLAQAIEWLAEGKTRNWKHERR